MGKYLLRRILQMIPVVLGTTLLVYALVFALPGDPVKAMFGDKPVNEAVAAQIRAEYNLDKPFIVQYLLFLKNALTFDFGKTFSGQLVIDVIGRAFPAAAPAPRRPDPARSGPEVPRRRLPVKLRRPRAFRPTSIRVPRIWIWSWTVDFLPETLTFLALFIAS